MKLMQMLKLTKLRRLLSRKPKENPVEVHMYGLAKSPSEFASNEEFCEELARKDKIGEALSQIMTEHQGERQPMNPVPSWLGPGVSLGQLSTFFPTQVRNLKKCFAKSVDNFIGWRSGYSNQALEAILVEFGGETAGFLPVCRKATPTVLITKRTGYKRKVNDRYRIGEVVCVGHIDSPSKWVSEYT